MPGREHPLAHLGRGRHRLRAEAPRLPSGDAEKGPPGGVAFGALRARLPLASFWSLTSCSWRSRRPARWSSVLANLKAERSSALLVTADVDRNVVLSARNIPGVGDEPGRGPQRVRCRRAQQGDRDQGCGREDRGGARLMDPRDVIIRPLGDGREHQADGGKQVHL